MTPVFFGWMLDKEYVLTRDGGRFSTSEFPPAPRKPHTGEPLKFLLKTGNGSEHPIVRSFFGKRQAARVWDSGFTKVEFEPYVLGSTFLVWSMTDRHKRMISDAADRYSESK
jgi:hypothetical protein